MKHCKIHNNTDLSIDNEIQSLFKFADKKLEFKRPPTIFLDNDYDNSEKILAKTGFYDPDSQEIHVYATGRHPKDVLRTIAHELVHHHQNELGKFDHSGYSGQGYAQKNPHLRKMEAEANDPMLFRDWEDSLKEKYPTIYNERRTNNMSLKDWKNKELSENLTNKWGFKMDLTKLNENKEVEEAHCGANEAHCNEEEELEEAAKPDFPDVDGDGDKEEPISKAQKDKKEKEGNDGKKKDLSKVPPQLRKHIAKK